MLPRTGCCPDEEFLELQRLGQLELPSLQELGHQGLLARPVQPEPLMQVPPGLPELVPKVLPEPPPSVLPERQVPALQEQQVPQQLALPLALQLLALRLGMPHEAS